MKKEINRFGVFTSGGDAPGMNACIRAVVRSCIYYGKEAFGIYQGYHGMIRGYTDRLTARSVSNIIHRGGTMLKSARSEDFKTPEGMKKAYDVIRENNIDALIAIGGDGTFKGAHEFYNRYKVPVIGIPGTIDNDLYGTDYTIGYDTATNTALEAIDKIRDTASSHDRLFFIEVMGRDAGFIAQRTGIAGGVEAILIPEREGRVGDLIETLEKGARSNKSSSLVVVAEGGKHSALELAEHVKQKFSYYDTRVTILGHIQRGGSPSCSDRILASRLGVAAVEGLIDGKEDEMVGIDNNKILYTPLEQATKQHPVLDEEVLRIAKILTV